MYLSKQLKNIQYIGTHAFDLLVIYIKTTDNVNNYFCTTWNGNHSRRTWKIPRLIRIRKSNKYRLHIGQKKTVKLTNNDLQNININKGNNKITELRTNLTKLICIERDNISQQPETVKTVMTLTWYRHFERNGGLNQILKRQTSRFHYSSKVPTVIKLKIE